MALIDEIRAKCSAELIASREHGAIADLVSAGRTEVFFRPGGPGLVLKALGATGGAALLDALEAQSAHVSSLKWALEMLRKDTLDFGDVETRLMIDQLLPPEAAEALKAVAVRPAPVSVADVIAAMASEG